MSRFSTPYDTRYMTTALQLAGVNPQVKPAHGTNDSSRYSEDDSDRPYRLEAEPEFSDDVDYALNGVEPPEPSPSDDIPLTAESENGQDEEDWEMAQRDVVDNMLGSNHPRRDASSETGGKDSGEDDDEASRSRRRQRGENEDDVDETHNPGSGSEVGAFTRVAPGYIGLHEVPHVVAYHEHAIRGQFGTLVVGCADVAIPGKGIRTVGSSAFMSHDDYNPMDDVDLDDAMVGGFFDAIAAPFKAVAKAAVGTVKAVGKAAIALSPVSLISHIVHGERLDHALVNSLKDQAKAVKDVAPYVQTVVSMVPGIGTGVAGAIAGAAALAEGRPITAALISAVRGAVPGGPLGQAAFDTAAAIGKGQSLTKAALEAARNRIPVAARPAFDVGLAVAHGQTLQHVIKTGASSALTNIAKPAVASAVTSLAHQTLVANVANAAKNLVTSAATGGKMLGLSVKVPGATPNALAAFGSATEALKKISEAKAAINAGEAVKARLAGQPPQMRDVPVLKKAAAGATVHAAALAGIKELSTKAAAGDPTAKAKVAILKIAKTAAAHGAGQHGHFVTESGQILKGNYAPV